jgi:mRNA-degrading endonuclease RelE of RelBE toxin-antitoxin system
MKYTVVWKPEAERRLADLWVNATNRRAITDAANEIDKQLGHDPETKGESRSGNRRILLESPLGILFKIDPQDRKVIVLTVWQY